MEKLLGSSVFSQSDRMSRFLRFAVEKSLAGEADALKEYLIGVEVFDRKPSYDPRVDPTPDLRQTDGVPEPGPA